MPRFQKVEPIKGEMLPYVPLVELAYKMWLAQKQREFIVVCTYNELDDCIKIEASDKEGIYLNILISKAREKYILTKINIEDDNRKVEEYDNILALLGTIFNL